MWQVWRLLCMKTCAFIICMWIILRIRIFFFWQKSLEEVTFYLQSFFSWILCLCVTMCKKQKKKILYFNCNSCYENESQCDILRTLPILFCAIWLQFHPVSNQRLKMKLKSQNNNLNSRGLTHHLKCLNKLKYPIISSN